MFTGLVEHVGVLAGLERREGGARLEVDLGPLAEGTRLGDSIAVDGLCLTVTALHDGRAAFDASAETFRRSTLGGWRPGRRVNLERALVLGARLGGHLVGGHVDGTGRLLARRREGDSERFDLLIDEGAAVLVVEKGSVAVDGVSLTSWGVQGRRFSVAVIPQTLAATTLGGLRPGEPVNLEQDQIGRWVEALLQKGR